MAREIDPIAEMEIIAWMREGLPESEAVMVREWPAELQREVYGFSIRGEVEHPAYRATIKMSDN